MTNDNTPDDQEDDDLFGDLDDAMPDATTLLKKNGELAEQLSAAIQARMKAEEEAAKAAQRIEKVKTQAETDKKSAAGKTVESVVKSLLPVVDNLERALAAITPQQRADDPKFDKLAKGVEQTLGQLTGVFNTYGVRAINPLGESFDVEKHEAVAQMAAPGAESDTVTGVQQKGYEIDGRIIRPAKVVVAP